MGKLVSFEISLDDVLGVIINQMIKSVILSRLTDGLIFCESNEGYMDELIQTAKAKVKQFHKKVTSYSKQEQTNLKQIQYSGFGIYYKINSHVVFTVIVQASYPLKLANAFIESLVNPFFQEAKCVLGSTNFISRLESIEGDYYFIKFDRTIKLKKKEFQDPNSNKNAERLKKELENIHGIMKQNMNMLNTRQEDLERTQQNAKRVNEEAKKFDTGTKKLVWSYWIKNNLIWIVLALLAFLLYFLIF